MAPSKNLSERVIQAANLKVKENELEMQNQDRGGRRQAAKTMSTARKGR